jgi:fermentation-respiration switch protein FrsA (DUF1100 family)
MSLLVVDSSGRNLTLDPSTGPSTGASITMAQRPIHATITVPVGADGAIDLITPHPLLVSAGSRKGPQPEPCGFDATDVVTVCIGLPQLDLDANFSYTDTANQPVDVSRVLDVILGNPDTFGTIDTQHVVYSGGSIGGITGLWFVHPLAQDPRLTAILATVSFAPYWVPAFNDPANWDHGPQILMVNGTADTTITYELVRRTIEAADGAQHLRLLSIVGSDHAEPYRGCDPASLFVGAWIDHVLRGAPEPDAALVTGSTCSAFGLVEGGTTGPGAAAPFIPAT